jgi:hypothetical protein
MVHAMVGEAICWPVFFVCRKLEKEMTLWWCPCFQILWKGSKLIDPRKKLSHATFAEYFLFAVTPKMVVIHPLLQFKVE